MSSGVVEAVVFDGLFELGLWRRGYVVTKVRHWHSKHVLRVLLEGLKIGPANVLLSIVPGVSILHRNVGQGRFAAWMWWFRPSLIKLVLGNFGPAIIALQAAAGIRSAGRQAPGF